MAAGLLLGAAMQPELATSDGPAGPQMLAGASGARAPGRFDPGLSFANYAGQIPDYVLGTDWRKPVAAAPPPAETYLAANDYVSPLGDQQPDAPADADEPTVPTLDPPPPEHLSYPSLSGGAAYEDASRAEKTPLAQTTAADADTSPEATGDTRLKR